MDIVGSELVASTISFDVQKCDYVTGISRNGRGRSIAVDMHILGSYMLPVRFRFKAVEQLCNSPRASEVNSASIECGATEGEK